MDIPADYLSQSLLIASWLTALLVWGWALATMSRARLRERDSTNVLFGAIACLFFLWSIRAGIAPQQNLHFLGLATLYLMFGAQYALLATTVLVGLTVWRYELGWASMAYNFIAMGVVPVLVVHTLLRGCQRYLPHNFFIYIFVNTFLAAGLSMFASGILTYLLIDVPTLASAHPMVREYPLFLLLLSFPEGGLNGMTMTAMVVYRPDWVATFHDRMYLRR